MVECWGLTSEHKSEEKSWSGGEIVGPICYVEHIVDFCYETNSFCNIVFDSDEWVDDEKWVVSI